MSWLPVGRQITIIVAASLCGIGYFAYIMLFKKQDGSKRKGLRKSRGRKLSALESEIFLRFTEGSIVRLGFIVLPWALISSHTYTIVRKMRSCFLTIIMLK